MPSAKEVLHNIARAYVKAGKEKDVFLEDCEKAFKDAEMKYLLEGML